MFLSISKKLGDLTFEITLVLRWILKCPSKVNPKYSYATKRPTNCCKSHVLRREYQSTRILNLKGRSTTRRVLTTIPNVTKSCTVLKQFTVVTMLSSLFLDVTQRGLVVSYRHFETSYWSHLQVSNSPRRERSGEGGGWNRATNQLL